MELQGYYHEEALIDWLQNGEITKMQFYFHHSLERRREFVTFCKEGHLELNEEAAVQFANHLLILEENADI